MVCTMRRKQRDGIWAVQRSAVYCPRISQHPELLDKVRQDMQPCLNLLETTHGLVALDFTRSPLNCWHYQAPQQVECLLGKVFGLKARAQFPDPVMLMDQDTQSCYLILKQGIRFCRFPAHVQIAGYRSFFKKVPISHLVLKGYQHISSCSECGQYLHGMPCA